MGGDVLGAACGARLYDLWGIPDEVGENPGAYAEPESWGEGGLWGVYRFKQGFGGQVVRYTGAWDLPLSGIGYRLYRLALRPFSLTDRSLCSGRSLTGPVRPDTCLRPGEITTQSDWDNALLSLSLPHVLQSWAWGETKAQTGWRARRLVWFERPTRCPAFGQWQPQRSSSAELHARVPHRSRPTCPKARCWIGRTQSLVESRAGTAGGGGPDRLARLFVKIDPDVRADTPTAAALLATLARRGWRLSAEQIQYRNTVDQRSDAG